MAQQATTLTAVIRDAVAKSGLTIHQIAREAGVNQPVLWRFMADGDQQKGIRLETADKLAAYFGLELRPIRSPAKKTAKAPAKKAASKRPRGQA